MKLKVISNFYGDDTRNDVPKFLFMEVNKRCNLRCSHCDFWKRNDEKSHLYLSREQKRYILEDLYEMNNDASLVICGGEPMLDMDEYIFMSRTARDIGLRVLSVVNGTRVNTKEIAENVILNGPHEISISFDDCRESKHDELRGVKNSFKRAEKAVRLLVDARDRLGADNKIIVMGLIHSKNYERIDEFYNFALNNLKADKLKMNFIQPSFGSDPKDKDVVFEDLVNIDAEVIKDELYKCNEKYKLNLNPKWINNVHMYFNSFGKLKSVISDGWHSSEIKTDEAICNSYDRNIMIDHFGFAKLCFSTAFGGRPIMSKGDLVKFWKGSNEMRSKMIGCKIPCGISHSVRKESATLK